MANNTVIRFDTMDACEFAADALFDAGVEYTELRNGARRPVALRIWDYSDDPTEGTFSGELPA